MDSTLKQRWLRALRSKEYPKTKGALCVPDEDVKGGRSYCCLGVLCEIAVSDGVIKPAREGFNADVGGKCFLYGANADVLLPPTVARWAGLSDKAQEVIASRNDDVMTFEEVIPIIEDVTQKGWKG